MGTTTDSSGGSGVLVYWRPGCPYCSRLRRGLRKVGLPVTEVNIWEDPTGAAAVRVAADGNETVPTVVIGSTVLVNPSVQTVVETTSRLSPSSAADDSATFVVDRAMLARLGRWQRMRAVKWTLVAGAVLGSFTAEGSGHTALSWGLDAVALGVWGAFHMIER